MATVPRAGREATAVDTAPPPNMEVLPGQTVSGSSRFGEVNVFGGIEHFSLDYETGIAALQKEQLYAPQNRSHRIAVSHRSPFCQVSRY